VPEGAILGGCGRAFFMGQTRLGGGRAHNAMRPVGVGQQALDLMCQRAVSRSTRDGKLADYQIAKEKFADSWIRLEQLRLLVMRIARLIDKYQP
jgi:acyl-CoA dehydrogenase